jgi:hypothetical protein
MCPAYLRGFAWPLALMPFARFMHNRVAQTSVKNIRREATAVLDAELSQPHRALPSLAR